VFNGTRAHTDIEIQTEDSAGIEEEQFMNIVYGKGKWHTGAVYDEQYYKKYVGKLVSYNQRGI
jgi:hypothetical protein